MTQQKLKVKRRLVDIVEDFRKLLITIHDNEGEVETALIRELDECEEAFESKVENCLLMVEEFKHQAEAYKKRSKALSDHSKAMDNRAKRLRDLIRDSMIQLNIHKMSTPSFPTVYLKETERLDIVDLQKVIDLFEHDEAVIQWQDPKVSKTALKVHLKDPKTVEEVGDAVKTSKTISVIVR